MIEIPVYMQWQSDYNGDELGYPEYDVLSLYTVPVDGGKELYLYIAFDKSRYIIVDAVISLEHYREEV